MPTEFDSVMARQAAPRLLDLLKMSPVELHLQSDDQPAISLCVPAAAAKLLSDILREMAQGHAVSVTSLSSDLSVDQTAVLLNTSRDQVEDLLRIGQLRFQDGEGSRRISRLDALRCKRQLREQRDQVLGELVAEAQELKLGY